MIDKKSEKKYDGIKAGLWYTIGNMIIKGLPFLSIPIFTNLLNTYDFGIYTVYISYQEILALIIGLGISGIVKIAKFEYNDKFEEFISSALGLILMVGLIFLIGINLSLFILVFPSWVTRSILSLLIVHSVSVTIYGIISFKYIIDGKYFQNLFIVFLMTGLNIGISLFLCLTLFKNTPYLGRIMGSALGSIFMGIFILFKQNSIFFVNIKTKFNSFIFKTAVPLIPHQLSVSLFAHSDKLMIQYLIGNEETGIYGVAVVVSMILAVVLNSIDSAWSPWVYSSLLEKKYNILLKNNNLIVIFFMYLTSCFILLSPDIIHLMANKEYSDSVYVLVPLIISVYLNFMYIFSIVIEYSMKKTTFISLISFFCLLINILLNYFMIEKFGYIGAAYATCISRFIMFLLHFFIAKKLLKNRIVSTLYLAISIIVVCFMGMITTFHINSIILRWIMIMLMTSIVLIYFYKINFFKDKFGYIKNKD